MKNTKEFMSQNLITINASDSIVKAYNLMQSSRVRHLPVLDDRKILVGIISDRDIQRAMKVNRVNAFEQEIKLEATDLVEDFMSWPVYVVSDTTSLTRVAEEMLKQKVSAFVVENAAGKMQGIVTTDDILKVFLEQQDAKTQFGLEAIGHYFIRPEVL